ncbi:SDR family NAD(P)-dependent oxidoreductase [Micromonospora sp. CPCC 205711]|uniref:SDR family NAD(P)-dependent oxidoreductase n=1 Tax=Micromonospora sp. CPCC 205547 TaxID=3122400 RepID=UPI002FF02C87
MHWVRIAAGVTGRGVSPDRLRAAVAGRTVLVTGASEGIGAATARRLAEAGAVVLLVARTASRLEQVRDEIVAGGGVAYVHPADLSVPAEAAALAKELLTRYRRIDVVVNNAGRSIRRAVADTADRFHDLERTINLNYLGPAQLLLVLLSGMRTTGGGHVVNVSTAGLAINAPHWSAYHASKAAFDTWLRTAAAELRHDDVTVSTVYCNLVRTRMLAPTAHYRRAPAMSADEAAGIVCRAVARPRTWWPWWARLGSAAAAALPRAVEGALAAGLQVVAATEPVRVMVGAGLLRPGRLVRLARAGRRHGRTLATAVAAGSPTAVAVIDEDGPATYGELDTAAGRCAAAAQATLGVQPGDRVGLACRDHRGFVAAAAGLARAGADVLLLPPDLPADRLTDLVTRERLVALVHESGAPACRVPAVPISVLLAGDPATYPPRGRGKGRMSVLTSGTTGTPRSVSRPLPVRMLLGPAITHLRLTPVRPGEPIAVAAPVHHGYGLTYLSAGLTLGGPVVLVSGRDTQGILDAVEEHRARLLVALPIQLRRMCDLPVTDRPPLRHLRAVISGAAPLPAELGERLRGLFGDRVFNMYATTEAGWAAMATPTDLRAAPGTVGRSPRGVRLRVVDRAGAPLPPGHVGEVQVSGWQPGGAWLATGDLGHLDLVDRLLLDGRIDDMIVSGGENVYPGPVVAVITSHPDVADAVLRPVPDEEFGQRLLATVEVRTGRTLTEASLREWLRHRLTRAELRRDIVIVATLPRSATGKPTRDR